MANKKAGGLKGWLRTSVWAFPVLLFLVLILFTALRISGTSEGVYYQRLYGNQAHDPNLIYGHPQAIRSDEWLVGTQEVVSQSKNGFPRVNSDMTAGQDLSLQPEVPVKDWPTLFKPQNWSFFVLPLEYAFAFKWWLLMYLLMVSCYFFVLRVLPNQKLFAALFGIAIGLSPFEMWWYQSDGFLTLAYGFFMIILLMRLMGRERVRFVDSQRWSDIIHTGLLAFLMACFGLLLYPPFQIPVAVVLLFFFLGYMAHQKTSLSLSWGRIARRLIPVAAAAIAAGLIGGLFILSHKTPIKALDATIYPGHRTTSSGGMRLLQVLDSFVMPAEQSTRRSANFFTNPSEASNFILLLPFLILPGFALMWREWHRDRRIDWLFFALQICALLLLARAFIPFGSPFYKLLLLQKVPNNGRLVIGIGFLGIIQLIYLIRKIAEAKIARQRLTGMTVLYGLSCFIVLMWTGSYIREHYPLFLHNLGVIVALAALFTAIIMAFLSGRRLLAVSLFLLLTLASSFRIIPLYRGLGVIDHSSVVNKMSAISKPGDSWVTVGSDAGIYENFGLDAGRRSISGTQVYPNLAFWNQLGGPQYQDIYNREGHAFFVDNPGQTAPVQLLQGDAFLVKFQCSAFIKHNAQFALSVHPLTEACVTLKDTIKYPDVTFYLYQIG